MKPNSAGRGEDYWNLALTLIPAGIGACAAVILIRPDVSRVAAILILLLASAGTLLSALRWRQRRRCPETRREAPDTPPVEERKVNANAEFESLVYSVSHDLRAPLRAVDGFSQLLVDEHAGSLDDEGRRLLEVVRRNSRLMGVLIDELLAFHRLARQEIRCSSLDMTGLARWGYEAASSPEARARIEFRLGELPVGQGDATMLKQVWRSLLSNAVKFSSRRESPVIEVGGRVEEEENIYFVRDNGAGFDPEYAGKLFKIFQRLHGPREFEGVGAGLAGVRRMVLRHGGRVWAEGAVDAGATFSFALPRRAARL
jgi:light-regulated signal transduction histidine kinase (bacteriophytochrome)